MLFYLLILLYYDNSTSHSVYSLIIIMLGLMLSSQLYSRRMMGRSLFFVVVTLNALFLVFVDRSVVLVLGFVIRLVVGSLMLCCMLFILISTLRRFSTPISNFLTSMLPVNCFIKQESQFYVILVNSPKFIPVSLFSQAFPKSPW